MDPAKTYDYLTLARGRLLDRVRALTDEQYRSEHPIGLGSLARTLHHTRAAEGAYVRRMRGETAPVPAPAPEDDPELGAADAPAFDALVARWERQAAETRGAIAGVADWNTARVYRTTWEGKPYAYRAAPGDFFAQLALHEVHHRAQALHILRRLGVETEELDYNALMWERVETD